MRTAIVLWAGVLSASVSWAQAPVEPVIVSKPEPGPGVTVVTVRPHFVTAIRMPEAVSSVAVGDPQRFEVEHSPREPDLVFVKAITARPCESNLLISTAGGRETSLLLVSKGEKASAVDFVVKYQRAGSFLIEPDEPSAMIGETVPVTGAAPDGAPPEVKTRPQDAVVKAAAFKSSSDPSPAVSSPPAGSKGLDALLARQERAPLPVLYGGHPSSEISGGDHVKAGVSEVIDGGQEVIVLFSAVNPTEHPILLVPPQVQLGGKIRKGKMFRRWQWTTAEQLPVEAFRLSTRRLAPGERADGVVMFERPPYKQSNETLFLQLAEAGAIDKPALAPIGFGVDKVRAAEASHGRAGKQGS